MSNSIHLNLPFVLPAQAQKHVTHNEALLALDTLTQLAAIDRDVAAPPASPAEGDRYIVGDPATGAWSGREGQVATYASGAWAFHAPAEGWLAYLEDEAGHVTWTGTGWEPMIGLGGAVPMLGVNATPDGTNRLSVEADAILFSHDAATPGSGDMRLKLSKDGASKTTSLLFQTGFSGRAEIGATGDDRLHVKVSADGDNWIEALVIDATAGTLSVGVPLMLATCTVATLPPATGAGQLIFVSDETAGAVPAFSDGTDWRRVTDRAVVG